MGPRLQNKQSHFHSWRSGKSLSIAKTCLIELLPVRPHCHERAWFLLFSSPRSLEDVLLCGMYVYGT